MSPSSIPFWGILVALVLGLIHALDRFELYAWEEPDTRLYCTPAVTEGTRRVGREVVVEGISAIERFDLVRFHVPRTGETTSRVVGLPGEWVELRAGKLFINGAEVKDPYGNNRGSDVNTLPETLVPRDAVMVLNDARGKRGSAATDSREVGPIPAWSITHRFRASEPVR